MNSVGQLFLLDVYNNEDTLQGCVGFININKKNQLNSDSLFIVHLLKDFAVKNLQDIVYLLNKSAYKRFHLKFFHTHVISQPQNIDQELLFDSLGFVKLGIMHEGIKYDTNHVFDDQLIQQTELPLLEYSFTIDQDLLNTRQDLPANMRFDENIESNMIFSTCCDCGDTFEITASERSFYDSKGIAIVVIPLLRACIRITVFCHIILYYIVLYFTILYYTILYYTQ
jgi:hypothetical protein